MKMFTHTFLLLIFTFSNAANAEESWASERQYEAAVMVEKLRKEAEEFISLNRSFRAAPDASLFSIWDKEKYQDDINQYLDDAFETLVPSVYSEFRETLLDLDVEITRSAKNISELRLGALIARPSKGDLSLLDKALGNEYASGSRESFELKIEALEVESADLEVKRTRVFQDFSRLLRERFRVMIDTKQARASLYQVNGGGMIDTAIAAEALIEIENHLKTLSELKLDAETAREYFAVATFTRFIIVRMHMRHLVRYQGDWFPALEALEDKAIRVQQDSRDNLNEVSMRPSLRSNLEANIAFQDLMLEAIETYREVLRQRQTNIERGYKDAILDAKVSLNTLETIETALLFQSLVAKSSSEFSTLNNFSSPELIPLDNAELLENLLGISRLIAGS